MKNRVIRFFLRVGTRHLGGIDQCLGVKFQEGTGISGLKLLLEVAARERNFMCLIRTTGALIVYNYLCIDQSLIY